MSTLFSAKYLDKLRILIDEFEISENLNALLKFFLIEIEKDTSKKVNNRMKVFKSKKIGFISEINKSNELKNIYKYLKVIIRNFLQFEDELNLVIHINSDLKENMIDNLISLFTWDIIINSKIDPNLLDNDINLLEKIIQKEIHANNNIDFEYRKRYGQQHRIRLLKKLKECTSKDKDDYFAGLLININKSNEDLINLSEFSTFPQMRSNYINLGKSLQEIHNAEIINLININTIINIFPAMKGQSIWINEFSSENIKSWNELPDYNFNKLITITAGLKTYDDLSQQKNDFYKNVELFVIFENEINHLSQ